MGAFLRLLRNDVLMNNDVLLSGRRLMLWFLAKSFSIGPKIVLLNTGAKDQVEQGPRVLVLEMFIPTHLPYGDNPQGPRTPLLALSILGHFRTGLAKS